VERYSKHDASAQTESVDNDAIPTNQSLPMRCRCSRRRFMAVTSNNAEAAAIRNLFGICMPAILSAGMGDCKLSVAQDISSATALSCRHGKPHRSGWRFLLQNQN